MSAPAIPVFRPRLPTADRLLPYLERIDHARVYSNRGPLVWAFEDRLATTLGQPPHAVCTAASGTLALVLAILAHAGRGDPTGPRPLALMPAFTFAATAQAAELCGWRPVFADVDPEGWTLDPDRLRAHPALGRAGLVVAAAPYGRLPDVTGLARLQADTGVPVVIDAAAGFEALCTTPAAVTRNIPMALSFHATKGFSTGEGGAVIWGCAPGQLRVLQIANFGFLGAREAATVGLNAKLSEYHAAVGLAMLDALAELRAAQAGVVRDYARACADLPIRLHLPPDVSPAYALAELPDPNGRARVEAALADAHVDFRRWYGRGVDLQPYFARYSGGDATDGPATGTQGDIAERLPVTRDLCDRLLGLPTACDLTPDEIARIAAALRTSLVKAGPQHRPPMGPGDRTVPGGSSGTGLGWDRCGGADGRANGEPDKNHDMEPPDSSRHASAHHASGADTPGPRASDLPDPASPKSGSGAAPAHPPPSGDTGSPQ